MKANPEKCNVILRSNTQRQIASIPSSPSKKLFGITLDSELKFVIFAIQLTKN